MKFIVGVGNPGSKYEGTRHNAGFRVVDRLAGKSRWEERKEWKAWVAEIDPGVFLVKSRLFVNETGGTVRAAKMAAAETLVVCDDVNLDFGKLRLRDSGSAGGHHGLESVIEAVGTDFPRLRIGVRNPDMPHDLPDYVLGPFEPSEKEKLEEIVERASAVCESWYKEGFGAALNRLSRLQSSN